MMADVEVLAEDAAQIAAGKEYRSRPPAADQHAFLAEMRTYRADGRLIADAAEADLALAATSSAHTRTERAGIHGIPQALAGLAWLAAHRRSVLLSYRGSAKLKLGIYSFKKSVWRFSEDNKMGGILKRSLGMVPLASAMPKGFAFEHATLMLPRGSIRTTPLAGSDRSLRECRCNLVYPNPEYGLGNRVEVRLRAL